MPNPNQPDITFPRGAKIWSGMISQTSTNAPTAKVFTNTLGGNITWTYSAPGTYNGHLAGAFPDGKTVIYFGNQSSSFISAGVTGSGDDFYLLTENTSGNPTDALLGDTPLQIIVYP